MRTSDLIRVVRPFLQRHPAVKRALQSTDNALGRWHHTAAGAFVSLIRPQPRQLTVSITGLCNLRCLGCRYGRDFMVGETLPLPMMKDLLDDAREAGVNRVRLFGGEPMLHPHLPEIIRHSTDLGMDTYITTNGTLLEDRIEELFDSGLRWLTLGFYGVGEKHAAYTQREGQFDKMQRGIEKTRSMYGDRFQMQLNYVLLRPTCNLTALREAWDFAAQHDLFFHLDLYGYSIPFFSDGPNDEVRLTEEDRSTVEEVTAELVRLKTAHPSRLPQSTTLMHSVTDWLLKGAAMRIPCDAHQLLWVGPNGVVQLCDAYFELGNLHENRLRDLLFGPEHRKACQDAFRLKCPNCTCRADTRIRKHSPSVRRYRSRDGSPR